MAHARTRPKPIDSSARSTRRDGQRERLLEGMVTAANTYGYPGASVAKVIAAAGVSRLSFYEHFRDREDCFKATHHALAGRLHDRVARQLAASPADHALTTAVAALVRFATEEPKDARFLMREVLPAGLTALEDRDHTIDAIGRMVDERTRAAAEAPTPDLPSSLIIGATYRLLTPRLRHAEQIPEQLTGELAAWLETYERAPARQRWRRIPSLPTPPAPPFLSELPADAPSGIPPGRSRLPAQELARNQRERILYATAEVVQQRGYTAATIAEIATHAHVDRRVFYNHFADKEQAFLTLFDLGYQQAMAIGASAFFATTAGWAEQTFCGMHAALQFTSDHPSIAHMGYVESDAVLEPAIQRVEDSKIGLSMFLRAGNLSAPHHQSEPVIEAIALTLAELSYRRCRAGQTRHLASLIYPATHIALTPFIGQDAADEILQRKLAEAGPPDQPPL